MIRRTLILTTLAAALSLSACGKKDEKPAASGPPTELVFSILSAENQASMQPLWQPLLDDMSAQIGVKVKPYFATNYTSLVEAMRFKQVQLGWFSAAPALQAIKRADGEVLGRVVDAGGDATYKSVIIVKKGSGITLEKVLACDKSLAFGIGDTQSTSGTLAPTSASLAARETELAEARNDAMRANQTKAEFLSHISHERSSVRCRVAAPPIAPSTSRCQRSR